MGLCSSRPSEIVFCINDRDISLISITKSGAIEVHKKRNDHFIIKETEDVIKKNDTIEMIRSTITEL